MIPSVRRLLYAFAAFAAINLAGATGYFVLGHGRWHFFECLYMAIITVATVGSSELSHMSEVAGTRLLSVLLIISGLGAIATVQANLTTLFVEGIIGQTFRRKRMRSKIDALKGHVVVAGAGSTGRHVLEELIMTKTPFVVIDSNLEVMERLSNDLMDGKMLYVHGDATDDHALLSAGVPRARGVVAALTHDKDNLFVTLSARGLNPSARIVSKITENDAGPKMRKAGATATVNPTMIGGFRLASELIRPEVNEFLDEMRRNTDGSLRLEEVVIPANSNLVGKMLKDTPIRQRTRLLVIAVRTPDRTFTYNPEPDYTLNTGTTLIVMGESQGIMKLRELVGAEAEISGTGKPMHTS